MTDRGFFPVDIQMRTNVPHIFAIGGMVGAHAGDMIGEIPLAAEVAHGSCTDLPPGRK